eukprot:m.1143979 g.1143979  ORF g.1143979 m.1143979 type:complete len:245 (+) comp24461_c0_seq8:1034-1768(+)
MDSAVDQGKEGWFDPAFVKELSKAQVQQLRSRHTAYANPYKSSGNPLAIHKNQPKPLTENDLHWDSSEFTQETAGNSKATTRPPEDATLAKQFKERLQMGAKEKLSYNNRATQFIPKPATKTGTTGVDKAQSPSVTELAPGGTAAGAGTQATLRHPMDARGDNPCSTGPRVCQEIEYDKGNVDSETGSGSSRDDPDDADETESLPALGVAALASISATSPEPRARPSIDPKVEKQFYDMFDGQQ